MKLTADLILQSASHINASMDHELDLRGNFPLLPRLKRLFLSNNRIRSISPTISTTIPNINTLVLSNNYFEQLVDLEPLKDLKYLENLIIIGNPISRISNFRSWLIFRIPQLRLLNFTKIKDAERTAANALYLQDNSQLSPLALSILQVSPTNTFEPGQPSSDPSQSTDAPSSSSLPDNSHENDTIRANALNAISNIQSSSIEAALKASQSI
ncbi:U2 small nuclear ribonucleoprotein A' [Smittium culicis]|uniref:U2 small nuclear ribonucleoprotein A' n=1 Tax=Smittium culicis TaxID=133412 RepID=A0A1R1XTN1_9FUNG|nr:U2 small nuclear ribonucleoprotein A' [Smittium culicis]OMJ18013.1 U2 small nuclear ribonucleoprotein A' [Smittium culicis]